MCHDLADHAVTIGTSFSLDWHSTLRGALGVGLYLPSPTGRNTFGKRVAYFCWFHRGHSSSFVKLRIRRNKHVQVVSGARHLATGSGLFW
jgi:hypothetical protein